MKSGFLRILTGAFLAAGLLLPALAMAQLDEMPSLPALNTAPDTQQPVTPAITVAMVYQKLAGRAPDFNAWATQSDEYLAAPDLQKSIIMEQQASNLKNVFSLTTLAEPIIVADKVMISEYSPKNGGFSIESFSEDKFFPFHFAGNDYAVVVPDLANHQWQPVDIDDAGTIDIAAQRNGRILTATLFITPMMADIRAPLVIDGKNYWLISGELTRFSITAPGQTKPVLEKNIMTAKAVDGKTSSDLLNLYQNKK